MKYETIVLGMKEQVAHITFNRPKQLNALNTTLIGELAHCFKKVSEDEDVKIVIVRGEGGAFSSGGDIKEMLQLSGEEVFFSVMEKINSMIATLYSMPQVTIAAIEGPAAGLGLSIALATDYIVCAKNSKLAMNFIGIGLIPDGGGHFLLERRLGEIKAKQLIWEGKLLSAEEAHHLGLIDEVTHSVSETLASLLEKWLSKPMLAMIKTKQIYARLNQEKLLKALELEQQAQWTMRQTEDHAEGIKAFLEKRKPEFRGR